MNYSKYKTNNKNPNLTKKVLKEKELKEIIADNTIGIFYKMLALTEEDSFEKYKDLIKLYQNDKIDLLQPQYDLEEEAKQVLNKSKYKICRLIYNHLKDVYTLEGKEIDYITIKIIYNKLNLEELFKLEFGMSFGAFAKNELIKVNLKLHPKDLKDLTKEESFAVFGYKPITDPVDKLFIEKMITGDIKQFRVLKAHCEYEHRKEKNRILRKGGK